MKYCAYVNEELLIGPFSNEQIAIWEAAKAAGFANTTVRMGTEAETIFVPIAALSIVKGIDGGFIKMAYADGTDIAGFKAIAQDSRLSLLDYDGTYYLYDRHRFDLINPNFPDLLTQYNAHLTYVLEEDTTPLA